MCMYVYIYIYTHICIYIYMYREREIDFPPLPNCPQRVRRANAPLEAGADGFRAPFHHPFI